MLGSTICRRRALCASICLLSALLVGPIGCRDSSSQTRSAGQKLRVVATTGMVADAASVIGGGDVQVDCLFGPGVDPHLYRAKPSDTSKLRRADLVLFNGLHLEAGIDSILRQSHGKQITRAVAESIAKDKLRMVDSEGTSEPDPHVWFDVSLWMTVCEAVRDAMIEAAPEHADGFRSRCDTYLKELRQLDSEVRRSIATIPADRRILVTSHDAFGYFGRAYGMDVRGLLGTSTAAEAGGGDLIQLSNLIGEKRVPIIFAETSVSDKDVRALQSVVQKKFEFQVQLCDRPLFSDALGPADEPTGTYIGMIRYNVEVITESLRH